MAEIHDVRYSYMSQMNMCGVYISDMHECRSEMQRRNEKLEFERNKERLLFMKVSLTNNVCC